MGWRLYLCLCFPAGLRNRHRGHHCKEGSQETAAVQDLPVVPGQRVPRDEDVLRHHCLWGGKELLSLGFHLNADREQDQKEA